MHRDLTEADAGRDVVLDQAQLGHRADHVALLNDPDAIDRPFGILLDHGHAETALAQRDRRGQAADSAADDQNFEPLHSPTVLRVIESAKSIDLIFYDRFR